MTINANKIMILVNSFFEIIGKRLEELRDNRFTGTSAYGVVVWRTIKSILDKSVCSEIGLYDSDCIEKYFEALFDTMIFSDGHYGSIVKQHAEEGNLDNARFALSVIFSYAAAEILSEEEINQGALHNIQKMAYLSMQVNLPNRKSMYNKIASTIYSFGKEFKQAA